MVQKALRLHELWLGEAPTLDIDSDASLAAARAELRDRGAELGLPRPAIEELALAATELGRNQLLYAGGGWLSLRPISRGGVPGIEVVAASESPASRWPRDDDEGDEGGGLGSGLAAVRRLTDEMDVDVRGGEGLCVWARRFAAPVPRRIEVGIAGRALPSEARSGDAAFFSREDEHLALGLADGTGHGPDAAEAGAAAVSLLAAHPGLATEQRLRRCAAGLRTRRGAVVALIDIDEPGAELCHAAVGDIGLAVVRPRRTRRLHSASGSLGAGRSPRRVAAATLEIGGGDVVIMASDGIRSLVRIEDELALLRRPPIDIACSVLDRFARDHDDALVLVAR